jgi:hypothetical protein
MDDIVLRTIVHRFSDPESPDGYSVGFEPMPYDNLLRHGWSIPVEDVLIFIGSGVGAR